MDPLFDDPELRALAHRLRRGTTAASTPEDEARDVGETIARVAWSVLVEPGDAVAGLLIAEYGSREALRFALSSRWIPRAMTNPGAGAGETPGAVPRTRATAGNGADADRAAAGRALAEARARWRPRARRGAVRDALHSATQLGISVLLPGDAFWPAGVDDLQAHAPVLLWARGRPELFGRRRGVALVGARAATPYGEHVAAEFAGDLAATGEVILSGGAYGIDGAAHRASMSGGGTTVAFLAGGADRLYPSGHRDLFARIRAEGVLLSELPCGASPTRWRFLARNRLIAAAGAATVVVEAGRRSGSLNTANHAASLGRPLGAVPGPVISATSAGCHRLLREYDAQCVTNAEEVRELIGAGTQNGEEEHARESSEQTRLRDAMSARSPRPVRDLAVRSGLAESEVQALLGVGELEGTMRRRDDGWVQVHATAGDGESNREHRSGGARSRKRNVAGG